ncbi:MAG: heparan-alpha-glucosaminide N-acetyltransferase domain-containing protein [Flavobacteriaceae bacterium]|jgi:predicted acyltransferase|nr:heparan-alpha-glucosaminide N-acetyltransferase domain-containing protein [Flavobacteriaceae bacterium]MDG1027480.1 heparan-alpha-glucosaminide N-acetyltransferase domain-containing protein [Flavobacteriaceae bacterium]
MENLKTRLLSLDILRGLTIILMIIVNDPGSWDHVYAPLLHADWNGLTPTDYVFPTFIFIVGVSIVLSLTKQSERGLSRNQLVKKILWRSLKIYLVGIFLWLWPSFNFGSIRWVGVLPRIAFVFMTCGLLFLYTKRKTQIIIATVILVLYWLVVKYLPVPGIGMPDLSEPGKNWANYIDQLYLPGYLWKQTWDPEGILSSFPAVASGLLGMMAGFILVSKADLKDKLIKLFLMAGTLLVLGDVFQYLMPINKSLWSSSFVLMTGGISCLLLALFVYWIDIKGYVVRFKMAQVFGMNAIFAYTLAGIFYTFFYSKKLWGISLSATFVEQANSIGVDPKFASLIYALLYVLIVWIPTHQLYKRKIFIKL